MVRVFNAAKIVLNVHDPSDLSFKPNMRVFEAAGCQSLLLTDEAYGLNQLFVPEDEIICYRDVHELVDLANYYTRSSNDGASIAKRAHERAYRDHTYEDRIKTLLNAIGSC
jgi:spore maturation protein CgeB